uniref:Uncharacterized protein n=1 Tax=Setaria viridis TaxID=4556 RepID=A0A4U6WBB0_SETVI|nr:hypothetical protein SEVIR_1G216801v2 [Setaria viridis]
MSRSTYAGLHACSLLTRFGLETLLPHSSPEHHSLAAHLCFGSGASLPCYSSVSGILATIYVNSRGSRSLCMRGATFSAPPPCDGSF